jgi:hypothetical protein
VRRAILPLLLALAGAAFATPAAAAEEWRSEQPVAPGLGVPASIGPVGDIEFQAPNRGVLITAGNGGSPAGLYAYDGTGWYRYSTVCGGHEGRIAWAGPDDFWTISDQPAGQETGKSPPQHISLCHFQGGQVVASYAEPVGLAESYLPLNAAACSGPDDCWFAGDPLPGTTNVGAFHLHWDGATLSAVPSLTEPQPEIVDPGRAVESLAFHQGSLYESVAIREGDVAPEETPSQPSSLHRILEGAASPFAPLYTTEPIVYGGAGAEPTQLEAFRLTGDGEGLWAIAGAESAPAEVTALRLGAEGFEQVAIEDPGGVLGPGDRIGGAAAEPGGEDAWVGFREPGDKVTPPARLTRIHADGTVDPPTLLPGEGEGIGHKGPAGPIACPAAGQCWMATGEGWLFHLGPDLLQDTDPAMHVLVSYRPPDDSLPSVPPISLPEDNSGAYLSPEGAPEELGEIPPTRRPRPLYSKLHQRLIGKSLLEMTFVLHAKAHVRLIARRKGRIVAETPRFTMAKGPRSLRLRLDPQRWPSRLDLQVHAVGKGARR